MTFKKDFHEEVKEILSSVDMSKYRDIILNSKSDFQGYKETSDNAEQVELKHYHYCVKDDGREM